MSTLVVLCDLTQSVYPFNTHTHMHVIIIIKKFFVESIRKFDELIIGNFTLLPPPTHSLRFPINASLMSLHCIRLAFPEITVHKSINYWRSGAADSFELIMAHRWSDFRRNGAKLNHWTISTWAGAIFAGSQKLRTNSTWEKGLKSRYTRSKSFQIAIVVTSHI